MSVTNKTFLKLGKRLDNLSQTPRSSRSGNSQNKSQSHLSYQHKTTGSRHKSLVQKIDPVRLNRQLTRANTKLKKNKMFSDVNVHEESSVFDTRDKKIEKSQDPDSTRGRIRHKHIKIQNLASLDGDELVSSSSVSRSKNEDQSYMRDTSYSKTAT